MAKAKSFEQALATLVHAAAGGLSTKPLAHRRLGRERWQKALEIVAAIVFGILGFMISSAIPLPEMKEEYWRAVAAATETDMGATRHAVEAIDRVIQPVRVQYSFMISLLASLLGLMVTGSLIRIVNARQERFIADVYAADERILRTLESVVDLSNKFNLNLQGRSDGIRRIFTRLWERRANEFTGYLQYLSNLDVDVESQSEILFTQELVGVAVEDISAIAVAEQEFWGHDPEAEVYFHEQMRWLSADPARQIRRLFVLAEPQAHRGTAHRGPVDAPVETTDALGESKQMIVRQLKLTAKGGDYADEVRARYDWKVIEWTKWMKIMRIREDLVIYDNRYVRRGPLLAETDTELRRAYFRSNDAEVANASEKFLALWIIATPSSRFSSDPKIAADVAHSIVADAARAAVEATVAAALAEDPAAAAEATAAAASAAATAASAGVDPPEDNKD